MPTASIVHRTAIFTLHNPTRHVQAVLERAFRDYTTAYTALLHACARYTLDDLRGMATYALDPKTGRPRMNARALSHRLYAHAEVARTLAGVCAPLEGRLRQSVREQVAQTLMSYLALADAHAEEGSRGGVPSYPARLRNGVEVERVRRAVLAELATLADNQRHERALVAALQQTRQSQVVGIPFVGVDPQYGCGIYYQPETQRFYARLDVVAAQSRYARPITARGRYVDIKTGVIYQAGTLDAGSGASSFGRGGRSILVPLAIGLQSEWGRPHLRGLHRYDKGYRGVRRWLHAAFLPLRGAGASDSKLPRPVATPVSAQLVRHESPTGTVRYRLCVSFALPIPARSDDGLANAMRPLLTINRGIHHLVAAVITTPDVTQILAAFAAGGETLRRAQEAKEQVRQARQQRGTHVLARDLRESRLADHHIALCANQIVAVAVRHRAQVVMEDLATFASGAAIRAINVKPAARRAGLRAILNRRQFEALRQAVNARLELVGLPAVRVVSAAYISQTCLACGHRSSENRDTDDRRVFRCEQCGYSCDVDVVAAANVARKLAWLRIRGSQKKADVEENERTPWDSYAAQAPLVVPSVAASSVVLEGVTSDDPHRLIRLPEWSRVQALGG